MNERFIPSIANGKVPKNFQNLSLYHGRIKRYHIRDIVSLLFQEIF